MSDTLADKPKDPMACACCGTHYAPRICACMIRLCEDTVCIASHICTTEFDERLKRIKALRDSRTGHTGNTKGE